MKKLLGLLLAAVALSACGGGGGGSTTTVQNASPGGIWQGTDSVSGLQVIGIIDESGAGHFLRADGVQFVGTATTSGNSISGSIEGYTNFGTTFPDGSTSGSGTISGTIAARSSLSGTVQFTTAGGTASSGTLDLTFNQLYNAGSSLATIAGNYSYTTPNGVVVVTIAADGTVTAQDPNTGCVVDGVVSIIDVSYNAYQVELTYSSCLGTAGALDGIQFSGLLTYDNTVSPAVSYAGVTGSGGGTTYAIVYQLTHL